jgi:hypothetical protein
MIGMADHTTSASDAHDSERSRQRTGSSWDSHLCAVVSTCSASALKKLSLLTEVVMVVMLLLQESMILVNTKYSQYCNKVLTEFVVIRRKKRIKNREAEPSIYISRTLEFDLFWTIATKPYCRCSNTAYS